MSHAEPGEEGQGHQSTQAGSRVKSRLTCLSTLPPQAAVAQSFQREQLHFGQPSSYFLQFPQAMQRKRDHMIQSLQSVGLRPVISQGSYFLITDISDFSAWDGPGWAGNGLLAAAQGSTWPLSHREQDA